MAALALPQRREVEGREGGREREEVREAERGRQSEGGREAEQGRQAEGGVQKKGGRGYTMTQIDQIGIYILHCSPHFGSEARHCREGLSTNS